MKEYRTLAEKYPDLAKEVHSDSPVKAYETSPRYFFGAVVIMKSLTL